MVAVLLIRKAQEYEASLEGTDIPLALVGQAVDQPLFGTVNGKGLC